MSTTSNVRLLRGRPQPRVAEPLPSLPSSLSPTSDKVYTPGSDSSPMLPTFLVRLISATFNRYKTRPSDEHLSFFNCKCALISVTSEELSLTEIKAKVRYHNRIREIKSVGLSGLIDEEVSFENFMFLVMTSLGVEPEKETRTERSLPTCFTNTKRERWGNTARESEKQEDEPNLGRETTEAFAKLCGIPSIKIILELWIGGSSSECWKK